MDEANQFAMLRATLMASLVAGLNATGEIKINAVEIAEDQADAILEKCGIVHPDLVAE